MADVAFEPDYDNLGRVTVHRTYDYGPEPDEDIVRFEYTYETDENNIDKKYLKHRGANEYNDYGYDDLERLTAVTYHDSDTEAFNMDDLGNRDGNQTLRDDGTVNFTVDADTNRYTSIGGNNISHDDAGNMSTDKDEYDYFYDYENRLVRIEDSSSVEVATHDYDALGRRIRVIDKSGESDVTTLYYHNPDWQVLVEYDGSNELQRYYVYGNYIDEPLIMNDGTDDYYYAHDHLYSVVALLEADGDVIERYEYDAYGTATIFTDMTDWQDESPTTASNSAFGNPYMFTGRRFDVYADGPDPSGHYRHRTYDTYTARFLQYDPLGSIDSINLYEYATSNPTRYIDSLGLLSESSYRYAFGWLPDQWRLKRLEEIKALYGKDSWQRIAFAPAVPFRISLTQSKVAAAVAGGFAKGWHPAAQYLGNYLSNSGNAQSFSVKQLLDEVADAKNKFHKDINGALSFVEKRNQFGITFYSTWETYKPSYQNAPGWAHAIQDYRAAAKGRARCSDSNYELDYTYRMEDIYYWTPDSDKYITLVNWGGWFWPVKLTHRELRQMHRYGVMKMFEVHGKSYKVKVKWKKGQRIGTGATYK